MVISRVRVFCSNPLSPYLFDVDSLNVQIDGFNNLQILCDNRIVHIFANGIWKDVAIEWKEEKVAA